MKILNIILQMKKLKKILIFSIVCSVFYSNILYSQVWEGDSNVYAPSSITEGLWSTNQIPSQYLKINLSDISRSQKTKWAYNMHVVNPNRFKDYYTATSTPAIQDTLTDIIWEKNPISWAFSVEEAAQKCYSKWLGWRLPTIHELRTILSFNKNSKWAFSHHPNIPQSTYWSFHGNPSYMIMNENGNITSSIDNNFLTTVNFNFFAINRYYINNLGSRLSYICVYDENITSAFVYALTSYTFNYY